MKVNLISNSIFNQKIYGLPWQYFFCISALLIVSIYLEVIPAGLTGSLLVMLVFGEVLGFVGDRVPILKSYLGGGVILAIFGAASLVYFNVLPSKISENITNFMKVGGFLNFYIVALIAGSILGMDSKALIKIGGRYFIPIIGATLCAVFFATIVGAFFSYSLQDSVLVIALPIMGGGMGAGAIPMSQVYEQLLGQPASYYISLLVPALALGNVFSIIIASLLNKLGEKIPTLSGQGKIMSGISIDEEEQKLDLRKMGIGLVVAIAFYLLGSILSTFIPLHTYALMIIVVAIAKVFNLVPKIITDSSSQWFSFVAKNLTLAQLFGIGIAYTNLETVINALSIEYITIVFAVVLGAAFGAGLFGRLVGFYPIESAITAGLCMANMGGTGDVAVLSAAKRMNLMPFAQISSRLGGAFILLLSGMIVSFFL
ncbi:citrate:sodium symporter [Marinomonas sp. A3A]|uniref:2-hydroxycarboxylate transporter family protein n=1 Tax=Marinomonas sp. A3A TaxID=2065312 RepID=UPI001BB44F87|nr:2-hydroxycarboxylate transporter family protein [Marinomonas sp. A3A]QUX92341.1 citrate:sodium symporter [Marinomonas sp. A3A]